VEEVLVPLAALFFSLGPFFYWLKRRYDLKELEARKQEPKLLEAANERNRELEDRVRNLESIVTNVDYELNTRLAKIAAEQNRLSRALPALAPTAMAGELQIGSKLADRYEIRELLGRGGMGAVYLADDSVLGEPIALKVVSASLSADPDAAERFKREASAARRVSSPNVIRIHDLGQTSDGLLYISMEYFPGDTLADVLASRGTLSLEDNRDILGQVCAGLEVAHAAGVTHRDLKPGNVIVDGRGTVKLIDFGLATASFFQGMTATGLSFGTPEYMSPEQVRGRATDARSDVYSLGALAYHTLTGRPPFSGDSAIAIGFAHCSHEPRPARELRNDIPEQLDAMILLALAKQPDARPALGEFRSAL
jgi:serine/threonine-protein kinase